MFQLPVWVDLCGRSVSGYMLDVSTSGARVEVTEQVALPEFITLFMTTSKSVARHGKVCWQKGSEFGIQFVKP